MDPIKAKALIEAVLFLHEEPVKLSQLGRVIPLPPEQIAKLLEELKAELNCPARGLRIFERAGGYQVGTRPDLAPYLEELFADDTTGKLSSAALETLAIIAYRQPIIRVEIESIRGVKCDHVLDNLLRRKLIRITGRKPGPGRPFIYRTTPEFLKYFGLPDLSSLPPLESPTYNKTEKEEVQNSEEPVERI
ncbi:MAG: SMC-Scp complex subunit ScpB [Firmicutes bacterium]|nr:SMC-Scp complex subunit ScpB [Bacillota bacterium]